MTQSLVVTDASSWPTRAPRVTRPAYGLPAVLAGWTERGAHAGLVRRAAGAEVPAEKRAGFVGYKLQPERGAHYAPFPEQLHPNIRAALRGRGIDSLFVHQVRAFELAAEGHHVVVATPTASGKSLAYNLPVLDALCRDRDMRALYLFPTKALSRDQEDALRRNVDELGVHGGIVTYDGDTPADVRRTARNAGNLILTNPDMLHSGILPHHTGWARFFSGLRYVVLDELHVMRGVFGSHMANVLRRLERVAAFYGARPQYLLASATIDNAKEHAEALVGAPVQLVNTSGAPAGRRHVMVYNPPVVHAPLGIRQGVVKATVSLVCELLRAKVPTLVFGQSRRSVEVMLKYLRDYAATNPELDAKSIVSYRGGYLPQERRAIERALREGDIACVVATQALELGIDIGCLDAVVCAGYPGSVAALWQRFGRGGRRGADSVAILVASSQPIDQYFAIQPERLWGASVEEARIDANNPEVLVQHLKCAAFELPFSGEASFGDIGHEATQDGLKFLAEHRLLHRVDEGESASYHWAAASYPANEVSLRLIGWDNFVIIDVACDKVIAEMDWRSTHTMLHEQAIYQHSNQQWQVERLDFDNRKAFVRAVAPDYYTEAMTHLKVTTIEVAQSTHAPWPEAQNLEAQFGEVSVVEKVVGFKKIRYHTHENVGYGEVNLPEMQMHTTALALVVPHATLQDIAHAHGCRLPQVLDALRGLGHAMHLVATVGLMVDPHDLQHVLEEDQELEPVTQTDAPPVAAGPGLRCAPTLYLFDRMPGGVGLAERAYQQLPLLLQQTRTLLARCPCAQGCPGCVGPMEVQEPLSRKVLTAALFAAWNLPASANEDDAQGPALGGGGAEGPDAVDALAGQTAQTATLYPATHHPQVAEAMSNAAADGVPA